MSGLLEVAQELYARPLGDFVRARTALAAQQPDRSATAAVKRLPKPSVAAWFVNMLSIHRADLLDEVADVGEQLREAQEAGDGAALRELDPGRRAVLHDVETAARELAEELDQSFGPAAFTALHETMLAALSDPDAADAVRSGVLVQALGPPGFGPVDLEGATAVAVPRRAGGGGPRRRPAATRRVPRTPPPDRVAEQRAKALAAATEAHARAERALAAADDRVAAEQTRRDEAEQQRRATEKRLAELTQRCADLEGALADARREADEAREGLAAAAAAVDRHSATGTT